MKGPEVCLNLWYTVDHATGMIYSLSGRAYALAGTDQEKLRILHDLASTDFYIARLFAVPQRFQVVTEAEIRQGLAGPEAVRDPNAQLFEEVFQAIEKDLPDRMEMVNGEPTKVRAKLPADPLCVVTCIIEDEDGNLIPQVKPFQ